MANMPPPTMPPPTMAPPMVRRSGASDATRGARLTAAIIDSACAIAVYVPTILVDEPFLMLLGLAALAAYQIYLLSTEGQTIGKRVMNIRIVKADTGDNGGFVTNVLVRGILNGILGFIPLYGLVDILFIFRDDRRCVHDMIAGTKVVDA